MEDVFTSFRKYCRGMTRHDLLDQSILTKANLRDSLQMAYLLQLYRQENSLKCRLHNKLLIDDIHITLTEGRGCVAEGKAKKALDLGGGMYCFKLFDLVQP